MKQEQGAARYAAQQRKGKQEVLFIAPRICNRRQDGRQQSNDQVSGCRGIVVQRRVYELRAKEGNDLALKMRFGNFCKVNREKVVVITRLYTELAQSYMAQPLITFLLAVCIVIKN